MDLAKQFLDTLSDNGFARVVGVPCSLMPDVIREAGDRFVHAPNEGEALAYAAGAWLAGSAVAVLCQNSGVGNLLNALTSLCAPCKIPVLLIVGWRGQPGQRDEVQHELMGRMTVGLFEAAGAVCHPVTADNLLSTVAICAGRIFSGDPACQVILVPAGVFPRMADTGPPLPALAVEHTVRSCAPAARTCAGNRPELISAFVRVRPAGAAIVATTGYLGRELHALASDDRVFVTAGAMGHAVSVAAAIAEGTASPVFVVDGDGAVIMRLMGLAFAGSRKSANLCHLIFDNRQHESTGGQPTLSSGLDLCSIAVACGYAHAVCVSSIEEFQAVVRGFGRGGGPVLVHVPMAATDTVPPRIGADLPTMADAFRGASRDASPPSRGGCA